MIERLFEYCFVISFPFHSIIASVMRSIADPDGSSYPIETTMNTDIQGFYHAKKTKFGEETILF